MVPVDSAVVSKAAHVTNVKLDARHMFFDRKAGGERDVQTVHIVLRKTTERVYLL